MVIDNIDACDGSHESVACFANIVPIERANTQKQQFHFCRSFGSFVVERRPKALCRVQSRANVKIERKQNPFPAFVYCYFNVAMKKINVTVKMLFRLMYIRARRSCLFCSVSSNDCANPRCIGQSAFDGK